jgi:hypothetical protein
MMTPDLVVYALETVGKVGGNLLVVAGVVTAIYKAVKWLGRSAADFVKETVLPPIENLTRSVNELSERTHENTESIEKFSSDQAQVNLRTAEELAELRGILKGGRG